MIRSHLQSSLSQSIDSERVAVIASMCLTDAPNLNHVRPIVGAGQIFIPMDVLIVIGNIQTLVERIVILAVSDRAVQINVVVVALGNLCECNLKVFPKSGDAQSVTCDDTVVIDITNVVEGRSNR